MWEDIIDGQWSLKRMSRWIIEDGIYKDNLFWLFRKMGSQQIDSTCQCEIFYLLRVLGWD